MKTQFLNFGGGLIAGVLLVTLFSASTVRDNPESGRRAAPEDTYHLVPIKEFFKNVANYKKQHADVVYQQMLDRGIQKKPSRMFIYSIPYLEDFFAEIRAQAYKAELNPHELAIRFYYAVYPDDMRKIAGHDYSSLHTLYMTPSIWSEEDQSYKDLDLVGLVARLTAVHEKPKYDTTRSQVIRSFYLENRYKTHPNAKILVLDASTARWTFPFPSRSGSVTPYDLQVINQGQLCPPNCPQNSLLQKIDAMP